MGYFVRNQGLHKNGIRIYRFIVQSRRSQKSAQIGEERPFAVRAEHRLSKHLIPHSSKATTIDVPVR
jgi:hypothetical protein